MKFSLMVLGSNSGLPIPRRFSTAQVLNVQERFFLIDCGEGTQIQMRRFKIGFNKINHILLSHLHGDHFFGIFGLLSSFSMVGRKSDLHIYSHPDLEKILNDNPQYFNNFNYKIIVHPLNYLKSEIIFEDKVLTVESFPLKHRIPCCGFVFREKKRLANIRKDCVTLYNIPIKDILKIKQGEDFINNDGEVISNHLITTTSHPPRSFAFCSDTAFYPSIIDTIKGVDLLYHEATFLKDLDKQAKQTMHSTASDAANIAILANVGKLLIGHYSSRYENPESLLMEARAIFPNAFASYDGMQINVDLK